MSVTALLDRPRRRTVAALGVGVVAAAFLVVLGSAVFGGSQPPASRAVPTALARVIRTDVVERQQVGGTLGFSGSFTVSNGPVAGTVTWLPAAGAVVRRGARLYELDGRPVVLLYGDRPAWRDLSFGMTDGLDVRRLKENLLALGFDAHGTLALDDRFDVATLAAVEQLQHSLGVQPTGTLTLGSVVFLPGAVRIATAAATAGGSVQPAAPVLTATETRPAVLLALDPSGVSQLVAGDRVLVTMPDGTTATGHVATIGRVATAPSDQGQGGAPPSTPTLPVTIQLDDVHAAGALDQAPVQVAITVREARHVLAVPVSALLAQPGGGYAVDVSRAGRTQLVSVTTGLFDDVAGRVEVSGAGLAAGMHVEVPAG